MRPTHRVATLLTTLTVTLGGLGAGGGAAQAAPAARPALTILTRQVALTGCQYYRLKIYWSGTGEYAGYALWSRDPCGSDPGDALAAGDVLADGYGINAYLSTGRSATTAGHASPYQSPWVTGDLPEDNTYVMNVCIEKSGADRVCESGLVVQS